MKKKLKKLIDNIKKYVKKTHKNVMYVHDKCGKFYLSILFDMMYSYVRYGVSQEEYKRFEFYSLYGEKRGTYLTLEQHYLYRKNIFRTKDLSFLKNKKKFNDKFSQFINREVFDINDISYKDYENIVLINNKVICSDNGLKNFYLFDSKKFRSPAFMLEKIKKENLCLVEKSISLHKSFEKITDDMVVLSIVTIKTPSKIEVIHSNLKFSLDGKDYKAFVNEDTGEVIGSCRDKLGEECTIKNIGEFKVPMFEDAVNLACECASVIDSVREIEWNFCISSRKVHLLGGNLWEDILFAQTPEYLRGRVGLLPKYKNIMSKLR